MQKFGWVRVAAGALVVAAFAGPAHAYDDKVTRACTDDYMKYCAAHSPESDGVRVCMEEHRDTLSKSCVKALLEANLVPKKYLASDVASKK